MSHDIYASWASTELSRMINTHPNIVYSNTTNTLTAYASREGKTIWPLADGVINIEVNSTQTYKIALEFKRENEGVHGVLTALGQAHAYLHKGYDASIIMIPRTYSSHSCPGEHLVEIIEHSSQLAPIGVFVYDVPDETLASPFENKLTIIKSFDLDNIALSPPTHPLSTSSSTQWAHLREGSSDPSSFFRFLQISKQLDLNSLSEPNTSHFPPGLITATNSIRPGEDPIKYLSYAPGSNFLDFVWRHFWFKYVLNENTISIWSSNSPSYVLNETTSLLELPNGTGFKKFFVGRIDSIKNKLISQLNDGSITEEEAWEKYALNIHNRAHSFKEDIDSGLEHLRLLGSDGKPTEIGYSFVDACERNSDNPNSGSPTSILGSAIMTHGQLNAFLHYVFKLSNEKFSSNPLAFTETTDTDELKFDQKTYLNWIADELANNLRVMNTSTIRGGVTRQPFQAELAILRRFNIVAKFRIGVGLEINWPLVQKYIEITN